jgi:hypothetical protein
MAPGMPPAAPKEDEGKTPDPDHVPSVDELAARFERFKRL